MHTGKPPTVQRASFWPVGMKQVFSLFYHHGMCVVVDTSLGGSVFCELTFVIIIVIKVKNLQNLAAVGARRPQFLEQNQQQRRYRRLLPLAPNLMSDSHL
jgi:hypothetical protein